MAARVFHSVEELKQFVGREVNVSEPVAITQDMIDRFAEVTGDRQWIHVDRKRAERESPYRTTIAHGFLTLSLLSRITFETVKIDAGQKMSINYGLNRVRFPAAVPAGSKVRARYVLESVKDIEGGVEVVWTVTATVEGGEKPSLAAEWVVRLYV